jgi:glutathione S-transferase
MHRAPDFLALSRWGQVPVLKHGEEVMVQSGAILEYLAETLGKFGARDAVTRQRIREWLYWNADRLAPPIYGCYGAALGRRNLLPIKMDEAVAQEHRRRAEAAFDVMDTQLAAQTFLAGGEPTIADICCYGEAAFWLLCDYELERWPNVAAWAARLGKLPGFAAPLALLPMADAAIGWLPVSGGKFLPR